MHDILSSGKALVRPATQEDMKYILDFGTKFYASTELKNKVPLDPVSFVKAIEGFLGNPDAGIFMLENPHPVGVIAGFCYDTWFNSEAKTGQDLFWWIEPDDRGFVQAKKMLDTLEEWAMDRGARWFTMAATETMRPGAVEKFYLRRGYTLSERHFIRRL